MISRSELELTDAMHLRLGIDPEKQIVCGADAQRDLVLYWTRKGGVDYVYRA